ncbi:hypothetical protein [Kribbella pittospori]|nr:hypothetical protein [Kribbella pittospori]
MIRSSAGRGADRPGDREPIAQVARELGVKAGTLANWVAKDKRLTAVMAG